MAYARDLELALERAGAKPGDRLRVRRRGESYEGILLPRGEAGDPECVVLKLPSGYNAGLSFEDGVSIEKLPGGAALERFPEVSLERREDLPDLALIATGGTISSRVDYRTGGVHMLMKPEEILFNAPELARVANLRSVRSPFRLASEDMDSTHWRALAELVARELNAGARGVLVTHGTDTLGYTAAALSFMLPSLSKPVALVGAQRSPDRGSFDGTMNLVCAARYAAGDLAEVSVVMHGTTNDDYCLAHPGTKVRKMHTSRRDAFRTINASPLAKVWPDGRIERLRSDCRRRTDGRVEADTKFEPRVAVVKSYPGADPGVLDYYVEEGYRGLVLEASALGHVPTQPRDRRKSWIPAVARATKAGVAVAVVSHSLYGRVNPYVYTNLRLLAGAGAFYCEDLLPETAYVKLGFVLGHDSDPEEVRRLMLANLAGEYNPRLTERDFLG
jgi:glutamyl-tRNA(Gln) amidotransferase subunit D